MLTTWLSLHPFSTKEETPFWFPHIDKLAHFIFHLLIFILGVFSLKEIAPKRWGWKIVRNILLFVSLVYGLLIESLQELTPFGRSADIFDVLANLLGAFLGSLLIQKYCLCVNVSK